MTQDHSKRANYFLEDEEDDNDDEPKKATYEDKYKINKELVDDELSQEKLEGLCNCFVLENTPNGNALILYNYKTCSFMYYSDNSIPYKYLNTIARKYVNTYRCKQLYVNSENEIKIETHANKKEAEQKEQNKEETEPKGKKQIFAKFKNYNKSTTKIQQSSAHQQQNNPPLNDKEKDKEKEVIINRYTYQGKIANFNFLKKTDKKLVNKKLSLTFSDYKKLNL